MSTDDKNDSVRHYTTIERQSSLNNAEISERDLSNSEIHDAQLTVNNYFTTSKREENNTVTVANPSEILISDTHQKEAFVETSTIDDKSSDSDFINDDSSFSPLVTDVEYLPDTKTYEWEATGGENLIVNNAINTNVYKHNFKSDTAVIESTITETITDSTINVRESILPTEITEILSETSISNDDDDDTLFTVLEEPSEVLYGFDPSATTDGSSSTITENSFFVNLSSIDDATPLHISQKIDSPSETQPDHTTQNVYQSTSQLRIKPTPTTDYPIETTHNDTLLITDYPLEISNKDVLLATEINRETLNYTDYKVTSMLVSSLGYREDRKLTVAPAYDITTSPYIYDSSNLNSSSENVINSTPLTEPTHVKPVSTAWNSNELAFDNLTSITDDNVTFNLRHTDITNSSRNVLSMTKSSELSSKYELDDNNISSPSVQLSIDSTMVSHFSNVTRNDAYSGIDLVTRLVTKVPDNIVNVDVNLTNNKTSKVKEEHLTNGQVIVQQDISHDDNLSKENKPHVNNNFEKSHESDTKIINDPQTEHKNESNESKLSITTGEQQQIELHTSKTNIPYNSFLNDYISPSSKSSFECSSSPSFSSQDISSSYWIQTTFQPTMSISKAPSISPSRAITEWPSVVKFTTKETIKKDNKQEGSTESEHQQILPTVPIPTPYLSLTIRSTWSYFCINQKEFQKAFAKHLTLAIKTNVGDSQIVFFNTNPCNQVSLNDNTVLENAPLGTISLLLYVKDRRGTYSKWLTEQLGQLIMKNKFKGFNENIELQDVILSVQLHRKADSVDQHTNSQMTTSHSNEMGIIAAITISCIAGVCLILLCILLIILKRRHGIQQQRRCRPVADAYSLESISIYSSFCKRKIRASKRSYLNQGFDDPNAPSNRLNFTHLAQFSTDENAITEEYKKIPMTMAKLGEMPPGTEVKNRYANVIPFPETRVQLTPNPEVNVSDYINANFVRGFQGKPKHYIACQAPLESTLIDFWQMIWENQCKVILMITNWEETGVSKCAQYFSESITGDNHRLFGDYQITTKKIDVRVSFTITYLQLKNLEMNLMRDVIHFWFTAWPVQGVPNDKVSILEMLLEARSLIKSNPGPTVVHCSPGTGRTGTILAIHTCMQEFELTRVLDVPRCVYHLRRDRGGLVQTTEQYIFIYEVLNELACRVMNQSGRSSVRSSIK